MKNFLSLFILKLTNILKMLFNNLCNINKLKLFLCIFILSYSILLIIFIYFLYQRYNLFLNEIQSDKIVDLTSDITYLINNHPISVSEAYYNNNIINL